MRNLTGVSWKVGQIKRLLKKKPYMNMQEAADKLGCSREYVRQLKNRFDLPFKPRPTPKCWVCGGVMWRYPKSAVKMHCHQKCSRTPIAQARRFWAKVDRQDDSSCWEWQGARHLSLGYGWFCVSSKRQEYTHRMVWELVYGPVPDGMCVLHHCDNPPCCNPHHLFLGTRADNVRDRDRKGRTGIGALGWRKKVCKRGHDRTDPRNIYEYTIKTGPQKGRVQRFCRECVRERDKRK